MTNQGLFNRVVVPKPQQAKTCGTRGILPQKISQVIHRPNGREISRKLLWNKNLVIANSIVSHSSQDIRIGSIL